MSVLNKLASALGRNDEEPNVALAETIAETGDDDAVRELAERLAAADKGRGQGTDKAVRSDCIKVLYEVGERKPELIADYAPIFLELLRNENNRLVWGAMTALDAIASVRPETIYASLEPIMAAAEGGSVIARDHAVRMLIKLYAVDEYADRAFALLIAQLAGCPTNQLPMYAEEAAPAVRAGDAGPFLETLISRLDEIDKESKRKRVEKVIRKRSVST